MKGLCKVCQEFGELNEENICIECLNEENDKEMYYEFISENNRSKETS